MDRWAKIVVLLAVLKASSSAKSLCDYGMVTLTCRNLGLTHPPPGNYPTRNNINLGNNNIKELFSESFTGFPNNHVLFLDNNTLTELDLDVLMPMTPLNHFDASFNRISEIVPASVGKKLENLQSIKLNDNNITFLHPNTFEFAPNLSTLILSFNSLTYTNRPILHHDKLQYLNLQNNPQLIVSAVSFTELPSVTTLYLASCRVTNISGAFTSNTLLAEVQLQRNFIVSVVSGTFASTKSLRSLVLDENPLTRLDVAAVNGAMEAGTLSIADTPLACNCNYEALFWWAQTRNVNLVATCRGTNDCFFTKKLTQ